MNHGAERRRAGAGITPRLRATAAKRHGTRRHAANMPSASKACSLHRWRRTAAALLSWRRASSSPRSSLSGRKRAGGGRCSGDNANVGITATGVNCGEGRRICCCLYTRRKWATARMLDRLAPGGIRGRHGDSGQRGSSFWWLAGGTVVEQRHVMTWKGARRNDGDDVMGGWPSVMADMCQHHCRHSSPASSGGPGGRHLFSKPLLTGITLALSFAQVKLYL